MFSEGDIVEIPLPNGKTALGWILHKSKAFKDAVGVIVFGLVGESRCDEYQLDRSLDVLGPLYTNVTALPHYGWRTVARQAVTAEKMLLTRRLVGGGVYVGDEYIGTPDEKGDRSLREMEVMGVPILLERISEAFQ